jgi:hypothetical protein
VSTFRLTSACAALLLTTAAIAGCGGGGQVTTSLDLTTSTTTVTSSVASSSSTTEMSTAATLGANDRRQVAYASWSPAETIPAVELKTITDALALYGDRMLFPSRFPGSGTGPASAEFLVYWTPPTRLVELYVRFETEDNGVDVTVGSCAEYSWAVAWGVESIPGAEEVTVRGLPGRSYPPSDVSRPTIFWEEKGQYYCAAYRGLSVDLTAQQMIDWLESWSMLP